MKEKLEERREWLMRRSYSRVFTNEQTRVTLRNPIMLTAIPLYPMKPLLRRGDLLKINDASTDMSTQDFPLYTSDLKTASDSIYAYMPCKKTAEETIKNIAKERYAEINTFGQIFFIEQAIVTYAGATGIFLYEIIKQIYFMIRYIANFYEKTGYWGKVRVVLRLKNCVGAKIIPFVRSADDALCEIEVDNNIESQKDYTVGEIIENVDKIAEDFLGDFLWSIGLRAHSAASRNAVPYLQAFKRDQYGHKECPQCKKPMSTVDKLCVGCRT